MKVKGFSGMLIAAALIITGTYAVVGFAETSAAVPNVSKQEGRVVVEGTATIYGHWACGGKASVEVTPGIALPPVSGFPGGVQKTVVSVSVTGLECGDDTMNKHLRKALKVKDNPEIHFYTDKYTLENSGSAVKAIGELTIAGVTNPVELDATLTSLPQSGVRVEGKVDIRMRDYDVKPPSLFFGTLKVANDISVNFDTPIMPLEKIPQVSASVR